VLVAQNTADVREIGVVTSTVTFFRTLGGAVSVAVLGAVLGNRVATLMADGLARIGAAPARAGGGSLPDPSTLPGPVRAVVEAAYAAGVADVFLAALPAALLTIVAVALLPEQRLGTKSGIEQMAEHVQRQERPRRVA
jgi:Na+/melibiose symporter-like transporter